MSFKTFYRALSAEQKRDLARRAGTQVSYLRHVAYRRKTASTELAVAIERETGGLVRCEELLPDVDWAYLRQSGAATPPPMTPNIQQQEIHHEQTRPACA